MKTSQARFVYAWKCPVCGQMQYRELDHPVGLVEYSCGGWIYGVRPPRSTLLSGASRRPTRASTKRPLTRGRGL